MNDPYSPATPLVSVDQVSPWLAALPGPVAITGGTGFVGSHLVDTLCAAGMRPRVLVRDPEDPRWIGGVDAEFIDGSLEDPPSLGRLVDGCRTVVHLAGVLRAGRERDFDLGNRAGTANLVEAVREHAPDSSLVHVSSLSAAGPSHEPEGRAPDDPEAPVSAYGRSKLAGELEVKSMGDERRWCILRPPAVYGPRDADVLEFFKMAARGVATIPAGERWLTVVYVADVVRAILAAAAEGASGSVFHLGEPSPQSLEAILRRLAEVGGKRVRVLRVPPSAVRAVGLVGSLLQRCGLRRIPVTTDKATELLARHWTARTVDSHRALGLGEGVGLDDGAIATWRWYREVGWVR